MLNPNIEIKKWFYTNLTSASGLPVYDGYAPDNGVNEYVIMNGRASTQDQGKISYTNGVTIDVDIVIKNSNFGYISRLTDELPIPSQKTTTLS